MTLCRDEVSPKRNTHQGKRPGHARLNSNSCDQKVTAQKRRRCSPAELIVHADSDNRKIPIADVESVTRGEAGCFRRNGLGRVVQTDIVVFNLSRPIGEERILDAGAR